jgi:hypothetical protein
MINKGHWLRHYSRNLLVKGPTAIYSCMRFESKHYPIKQQIAAAHNYINVPKSIAKRQSLLQSLNIRYNSYRMNKPLLSVFKFVEVAKLPCARTITDNLGPIEIIKTASCCTIFNTDYKKNFVIRLVNHSDSPFPDHAQIQNILEHEGKIYLLCKLLKTLDLDSDFHAFQVEETKQILFFEHSVIIDFYPSSIWQKYGSETKYLSIKYTY